MAPPFYLVQRVQYNPRGREHPSPVGYGQIGDYSLDYMGAAEFEWGAIPEAHQRLTKAIDAGQLSTLRWTPAVPGQPQVLFAYASTVSPLGSWLNWIEKDNGRGKEPPFEFLGRYLRGEGPRHWPTVVWWGLEDNVLWSFADDNHEDGLNHLERFLAQMRPPRG